MTSKDRRAALLSAADQLETWADSLPRRTGDSPETWYEFLDRRYEAEVALMERLRLAPHCRLWACSMRRSVGLSLGGLYVSTDQGLEAALREWVGLVRDRYTDETARPPEPS